MKLLAEKLRPLLLVAAGLVYFLLFLGLRGTGDSGIALLERLRTANRALMGQEPIELASSPHPLVDLLAIPIAALADNEVWAFGLVSAVAVSLALPAIWGFAREVSGGLGAVLATGLFLGTPMVAGAATVVGEAAVVLLLWCWLLRLAALPRFEWWATLLIALLSAALALSWAPILIWLPAWIVLVIAERGLSGPPSDPRARGMIRSTPLPLALLVAPVAALAAPAILFAALGVGQPAGWEAYLTHSLLGNWPPVVFEGEVFATERPPLTTGLAWMAFQYTPHVVIAAIGALVLPATGQFSIFEQRRIVRRGFQLPQGFALMTLIFILGLPWALRTRSMGGVPTLLMAAPIVAVLAGSLLATLVRLVLEELKGRDVARRLSHFILGCVLGLFLVPGLVETVVVHPFEGSYYNWFAGSAPGAIEAGRPASRDDVLPIEVARSAAERVGARSLYAGDWRPHFEAYIRDGYIGRLEFTDDPKQWETRLREVGAETQRSQISPAKVVTWDAEGASIFVLEARELTEGP